MSRAGVILRLAWRESRASRRRLLLFGSAISVGVATLVAVASLTVNLQDSVHRQARELLGADLVLQSSRPFTAPIEAMLDSLARQGVGVARRTELTSMAFVPKREGTRLVDVRAVGGGFPFYGTVETTPPGRWAALDTGHVAIVDTSLLVQLGAQIGDTLQLGRRSFPIAGVTAEVPGRLSGGGFGSFIPVVYIPVGDVSGTGLIVFGSRASYQALLRTADARAARRIDGSHKALFDREKVGDRTAEQTEDRLSESLGQLSRYLQFVGLIALLLGGIGVASGVGAFVAGKLDTIAVLRCIGASRPLVFAVYLTQATVLGLVAAAGGAALGVAVQLLLPRLLHGVLPVDLVVALVPGAILSGLGIGVAVALLFALRPLLAVRLVPPLAALRKPFEDEADEAPRDPLRLAAFGAVAIGVFALAMNQADRPRVGVGFAVAIAAAIGVLELAARLAIALARRAKDFRAAAARWPYVVRQGVANLHRPRNQTRAVVVALGFGVALLATLYLVQANLLGQVEFTMLKTEGRPNLAFMDVQADQEAGVAGLVTGSGHPLLQLVPIVQMRIAAINGRSADSLASDPRERRRGWPLRREYRSTFRDSATSSERVVAGAWWHGRGSGPPYPVSLATDIAQELKVGVGDRIDWSVQGTTVPTVVVALRTVDWARMEPNFFAVFSTAALEHAPRSSVVLTRVDDAGTRGRLEREVSEKFPNVTGLDVALLESTIERVLGRVSLAIRFMAAFSLATGALVLLGAVTAGRLERIREGALLKTLGATRRQLTRILLAEYTALGLLAGLVGVGLSTGLGWAMVHWVFDLQFALPVLPLVGVLAVTAALVALVGIAASREVFRRTAMDVLREP